MKQKKDSDKEIKVEFLLPCKDNDGRDLTGEIEDFLAEIYPEFLWTFDGYVKGVWRSVEGEKMLDTSMKYFVITNEKKLGKLQKYLLKFKSRTKQETIICIMHRDTEVKFL